jgi:diacylglycerol kinase (ATP)
MSNHKKFSKYNILSSFSNAAQGLIYGITTEPSAVIQISLGVILTIINLITKDYTFMTIQIIVTLLTLSQEVMNTSIEYLCDFITMEHSPQIKRIKDLAAGSVLFASMAWGVAILLNIINLIYKII